MKSFIVACLIFFCFEASNAQNNFEANLILLIDEELVIGTISNVRINSNNEVVEASYQPGTLSIKKESFNRLISQNDDSLSLSFDYYKSAGKKQLVYNYKLPFIKKWFVQTYLIMKVYNLENRKYRGRYEPLDAKRNYSFEIIYPEGQIIRF